MNCDDKVCNKCANYDECVILSDNKFSEMLTFIKDNPKASAKEYKEVWDNLEEKNRKEKLTFRHVLDC